MSTDKRTHILALTFSVLSIIWVSSAVGLLPASAGNIEDRMRERKERKEALHEASPRGAKERMEYQKREEKKQKVESLLKKANESLNRGLLIPSSKLKSIPKTKDEVLSVAITGPTTMMIGEAAAFKITITNKGTESIETVQIEQEVFSPGYESKQQILSFVIAGSDTRCTQSRSKGSAAKCSLADSLAPSATQSFTIVYKVERCLPGFKTKAVASVGSGRSVKRFVSSAVGGVINGCSPSDGTR